MAIQPLIHMNGTSARSLYDQARAVMAKVIELRDALGEASPNGRDYYPLPQPDSTTIAVGEHRQLQLHLEKIALWAAARMAHVAPSLR